MSLLPHAQDYALRGWAIIPVREKQAALKWKPYQVVRPTPVDLATMFADPAVTGLAVILGPVSGNLACRDFDEEQPYLNWAKDHPDLAASLPTVKTSRGYHVYFTASHDALFFKKYPSGEYRATPGQYCLLPPSRHPSGSTYTWLNRLPDRKLPTLDPFTKGLIPQPLTQPEKVIVPRTEIVTTQKVPQSQNTTLLTNGLCKVDWPLVLEQTLPSRSGQRNNMIFSLARRLRSYFATPEEARSFFADWFHHMQARVGTRSWDESWADFRHAWASVRLPHGAVWDAIVSQARTKCLVQDKPYVAIMSLALALHNHHGPGVPFPFPCRKVGQAIRLNHDSANDYINYLVKIGVLLRVKKPVPRSKAAEYLLAPPLGTRNDLHD